MAGVLLLATFFLGSTRMAWAASTPETIRQIGQRWDEITYHWPKENRGDGLTELLAKIRSLKQFHPQQPELLIWEAIVLVTRAGIDPGLTILGNLDKARDLLLLAIELEPEAMDGAAFLTLACLYYKAPGWPLSFGDSEKAEEYFQKALALNPEGIENNYYYASFLSKTDRSQEAFAYYQKTAGLPNDPTQPYLSLRLKQKAAKKLTKLVASSQY